MLLHYHGNSVIGAWTVKNAVLVHSGVSLPFAVSVPHQLDTRRGQRIFGEWNFFSSVCLPVSPLSDFTASKQNLSHPPLLDLCSVLTSTSVDKRSLRNLFTKATYF